MKILSLLFLLLFLPFSANAYDIAVENKEGVTIYYNYINDKSEVEVTFKDSLWESYVESYKGNVSIPEYVDYMDSKTKVTSIGDRAFYYCRLLTSVEVPQTVISIGREAFSLCDAMQSINIPNKVVSIGESAFNSCYGITSLTIPDGVTVIEDGTFCYCTGLEVINLPSHISSIGNSAFYKCMSLNTITLPEDITSIGDYAFGNCSTLASINIPTNCTSIGYEAFRSCSSFTTLTIPDKVVSIGGCAFYGCSSLKSLYAKNETPVVLPAPRDAGYAGGPDQVFEGIDKSDCILYVPDNSVESYKSSAGWKTFDIILPLTSSRIGNVKSINSISNIFDINGVKLGKLSKRGVNIVRYEDGKIKKKVK